MTADVAMTVGVLLLIGVLAVALVAAEVPSRKRRCTGPGTHNFQPRYTEVPRQVTIDKLKGPSVEDVRPLLYTSRYECDVCVWCGRKAGE